MFIRELEIGSEITLVCGTGSDKRSFTTNVLKVAEEKNVILVEAFTYDGKLLNFDIEGITVEFTQNGKAMVFQVDSVKPIKIKNNVYHSITSETDAKPVNRRGAVRIPMGVPCTMKYGPKRVPVNCFVHDLSYTGVSFTLKQPREVNVGDELNAVFHYGENRVDFKVFATVVRTFIDDETGYQIVGAEFKSLTKEVQALIMAIQRDEAQRRRGK